MYRLDMHRKLIGFIAFLAAPAPPYTTKRTPESGGHGTHHLTQAAAPHVPQVTVSGLTVTRDQVARIAPVVLFRPDEPYLPCSIENLLERPVSTYPDGPDILSPTQKDLQAHSHPNARLYLDAGHYHGQALGLRNAVQAPMYVSVQVPHDRQFVDVNFWFLFAFNGPQTVRVAVPHHDYTCVLPHIAEHEGDIEGVTVRVTADFQTVLFVRVEGHGRSTFLAPKDVEFETHPVVRVAYNSHATYAGKGRRSTEWVVTDPYRTLGFGVDFIDVTSRMGPRWAPFSEEGRGNTVATDPLRFVGIDDQGAAVGEQVWAAFAGRIGAQRGNHYVGATRVGGGALSPAQRLYANIITKAVVTSGVVSKKLQSNGTHGMAKRPAARAAEPVWDPPSH